LGKKIFTFICFICLSTGLASSALAQEQTGSLKGKLTDTEGFPLPGAIVYINSDSMLDIKTYITSDTGIISFHNLPSGKYKLTAEMPGFKTVNIENIIIRVGTTVRLHIKMEVTTIEEETTVKPPAFMGNPESAKTAVTIEEDLLKRIPLSRDLHHIIDLAPGVIHESIFFPETSIIHGASARANLYLIDGLNSSDPGGMQLITNINFDLIEEVEVVTAGFPSQVGPADGAYINIVTKSGGNKHYGELLAYHTSEGLTNNLMADEGLGQSSVSSPPLDKKLWDFSLSYGGPILRDKLWFFTNARHISQSRTTSFIPWTDPQGKEHNAFNWDNTEWMGFIKLTSQFVSYLKVTAWFNYVNRNRPFHENILGWNVPADATRSMDHEKIYQGNAILNYLISQDTFVDLKAGFLHNDFPLFLQEDVKSDPTYVDVSTGHIWGSGFINEDRLKKRFQASVFLTRFQNNVFGANHELKIGGEYESSSLDWSAWKENNLTVYYNNGSPYYFGLHPSPFSGNTVGIGKISFFIASKDQDRYIPRFDLQRLSLIFQDTATFAQRFTLDFGIRFDRSTCSQLSVVKDASGNPISVTLGETLIKSQIDLNPYDQLQASPWKNIMTWNVLSPHLGLIFDLFGNGRSLLKASYSRYSEQMLLEYAASASPFTPTRSHSFYWYDENLDEEVDENDSFSVYPEDFRLYFAELSRGRVAPDTKAPHTNEFTFGFGQDILSDLSINLTYILRNKKDILESVLYNPDLNQYWYTVEQDTEGWWTSFDTIVPGADEYENESVTVYFPSATAPLFSERFKNVPELSRKYQGFEIAIKKRMSHNWQLNGSVIFSKTSGNINQGYFASSGATAAADSPNYFVNFNEEARLDYDRPLIIKLAGTYRFPHEFYLSINYVHMSGAPWARSVTVFPIPQQENMENPPGLPVTVFLEEPGTRRTEGVHNLDIRIEKEIALSASKRIDLFLDIFNVLGNQYQSIVQNDGGFWYPSDENSSEGIRILDPSYKKVIALSGVRSFRLGLNLKF
jgi:hypothetical protein